MPSRKPCIIASCTLNICLAFSERKVKGIWSRYVSRLTSLPSSNGISALEIISIFVTSSSISPFWVSALIFFSGRALTIPVTDTTYSLRTSLAVSIASDFGSTTPCTEPERSRKSKKTILPWSRRTLTEPCIKTDSPFFPAKSPISVRSIKLIECYTHLLPHEFHFCLRFCARDFGAIFEDLYDRLAAQCRSPLAHWRYGGDYVVGKQLFRLLVPYRAVLVALLYLGEVRRKVRMQLEGNVGLRIERRAHGGGVGLDGHDRGADGLVGAKERDSVVVALAHLFAVYAGYRADAFEYHLLRFFKSFAIGKVKFCCRLARVLDVLALVLAHRHHVGVVQKNIRRHQHRVIKKPRVSLEPFSHLIFVRMCLA